MKYVIDVPEDRIDISGIRTVLAYANTTMAPYVESDTAEQAWKIAQDIMKDPGRDGMLNAELNDCFGTDDIYMIAKLPYAEIKEKYDAWQKRKNEIKVGDEVRHKDEPRDIMVYTGTDDEPGYASCIKSNGRVVLRRADEIERTGRHFPEVADLLKKMRESEC